LYSSSAALVAALANESAMDSLLPKKRGRKADNHHTAGLTLSLWIFLEKFEIRPIKIIKISLKR
jgi:hypothetical protein